MTRKEFEEKSRRILSKDGAVSKDEFEMWVRGRDWLASRLVEADLGPGRRRYPRAKLSVPAHVAGIGNAITEDIGFRGLSLRAKNLPALRSGEEQSVRVSILGRSIYATARVVWSDDVRMGLSIIAIHPADEYALQAAVCVQHLEHWAE